MVALDTGEESTAFDSRMGLDLLRLSTVLASGGGLGVEKICFPVFPSLGISPAHSRVSRTLSVSLAGRICMSGAACIRI